MRYINKNIIEAFNKLRLEKKKVVLLWTSNTSLTPKGNVVMGAGLAKQMVSEFKGIKRLASEALAKFPTESYKRDKYGNSIALKHAGVHTVYSKENAAIMAFPVKRAYWENAEIGIIKKSMRELKMVCKNKPDTVFLLNMPGVGAGRLKVKDVELAIASVVKTIPNLYIFLLDKQVK